MLWLVILGLMVSGCVKKLVIYPIKGTDFCVKNDPDCNMCNMQVGMSDFYYNKVLNLENAH